MDRFEKYFFFAGGGSKDLKSYLTNFNDFKVIQNTEQAIYRKVKYRPQKYLFASDF